MSDSVRSHRWQPTRLPRPWDSPGKNTGVGCHFLLQCMKVKSESEVAQSCLTLCDPMDCSLPGSTVHGIFQARVQEVEEVTPGWVGNALKWVAIPFSRGSPQSRGRTQVSCIAGDSLQSETAGKPHFWLRTIIFKNIRQLLQCITIVNSRV